MDAPGNERGLIMLATEYFAAEDDLFLDTIRRISHREAMGALTDCWKKDPRPWARRQIFGYLSQPLNCPGHQAVVKRLFRQAEESHDHELMAAFLVALDRQVRRKICVKRRWDHQSSTVIEAETLVTPRDVIPLKIDWHARNPCPARAKLFKYRTRYYLRRRAWRYFRRLGFRDPAAYLTAIIRALREYGDEDLQRGENILDSWALMHVCFGEHEALEFGATHIQLKEGRGLGDLSPAPVFPEVWKTAGAAPMLLSLALNSRARLVRLWAMQLFQREHPNHAVALDAIISMLDHEDAGVQQFGARLLETSAGLGTLPVSSWLRLLQAKNEEALQRICDAFVRHVSGDRLDLTQCIGLASLRPVPAARLGQKYLNERVISSSLDREHIAALADARCPAVAGELTAWALAILGSRANYNGDQVIRFFDSTSAETRAAAWNWLESNSSAQAREDALLWSRLVETPYDDVRLRVLDFLQREIRFPGMESEQLENIWRTVLLGVHRGGRQKAKAVQQIARAIVENPARADTLLPVLAVAVRSVRGPEARAGLAAVASLVEALPQKGDAVRRLLPEMKFLEAT